MTESAQEAEQEAADWLARLNARAISVEELDAFREWRRDPANAAAYARAEALWQNARTLSGDTDIAGVVREALARPRLARASWRRPDRRLVLAGAAALPLAATAGWLLSGTRQTYRTGIGEQLLVSLDDGSRVRLNTQTELAVEIGTRARAVDLLHGQAFFDVARDAARPFLVRAGSALVRALGTQFDCDRAEAALRVVLAEGRIAFARKGDAEVVLDRPGQSVELAGDGKPRLGTADIEAITSWTRGTLLFRGTPLGAAIAQANRYSQRRIVLGDPRLQDLPVDGVFDAGDTASFALAVATMLSLKSRQEADGTIVLSRE